MADGSLKVEPGDVVLERGDDGDQCHQNYSYVHTWCKSPRVVPGHNQVVMILQSLCLFTCNSCRTSPQGTKQNCHNVSTKTNNYSLKYFKVKIL